MSLVGRAARNHPQQVAVRGANERDNLGTDPALFAKLDERFTFTLDVAATAENAKCDEWFDVQCNGLERGWHGRVWCNPPYSQIRAWVEKAWFEWRREPMKGWDFTPRDWTPPSLIVMLLPANRPEQGWWQDLVEPFRDREGSPLRIEFLRGRQRFVLPGAESIGPNERPPFGCCLLIWRDREPSSIPTSGMHMKARRLNA